jgi:hypothetical protein
MAAMRWVCDLMLSAGVNVISRTDTYLLPLAIQISRSAAGEPPRQRAVLSAQSIIHPLPVAAQFAWPRQRSSNRSVSRGPDVLRACRCVVRLTQRSVAIEYLG